MFRSAVGVGTRSLLRPRRHPTLFGSRLNVLDSSARVASGRRVSVAPSRQLAARPYSSKAERDTNTQHQPSPKQAATTAEATSSSAHVGLRFPFDSAQSLKVPHPLTPPLQPSSLRPVPVTECTTLANGLRVASQENYAQTSSIALFVDTGSRYEPAVHGGLSHFYSTMSFKTTAHRTREQLNEQMENTGAATVSASSREVVLLAGDTLRHDLPMMVDTIADNVLNPSYTDEDMAEQRELLKFELDDLQNQPDRLLPELLHEVAYGGQNTADPNDPPRFIPGLGNLLFCPPDRIDEVTARDLREYSDTHLCGKHIVFAGVGCSHSDLVSLAKQYGLEDLPAETPDELKQFRVHTPAVYHGGSVLMPSLGETEEERLTREEHDRRDLEEGKGSQKDRRQKAHLAIAFEGPDLMHKDYYTASLLRSLMGGGSSFSTGGPGKGMHTRLYTRVLNQPWYEDVVAFYTPYVDSALFGIYFSVDPGYVEVATKKICGELLNMAETIFDDEFERAKNQLKSGVFTMMEQRASQVDDIGRQIMLYGKRTELVEQAEQIDRITKDDVLRVAREMIGTKPTMAVLAEEQCLNEIPTIDEIGDYFRRGQEAIGK